MRRLALLLVAVVLVHPTPSAAAATSSFPCGLASGGWLSEGPTDRAAHLPSVGTIRATVVLVDFPEHPATEPAAAAIDTYVKGAQRWWSEVSYGRFQIAFDAPPRWTRMPASAASYQVRRGLDFETHRRYLTAAVAAADPTVDFSRTQLLVVVSPPAAGIAESPAFIAPAGRGITADGNELRWGTNLGDNTRTQPALPAWAVGMFVHEVAHTMGLPDLYELTPTGDIHRGVGAWDLMGYDFSAAPLLAWHRWKLGWLDDAQVSCVKAGRQQLTLTPLGTKGGLKAVVVPTGKASAIVAEVRTRTGFDGSRCDEGLLVYTVDTSRATGRFPVQVRSAQREAPNQPCLAFAHAPFDLGKGENPRFTDPATRTTIQVAKNDKGNRTILVTKG